MTRYINADLLHFTYAPIAPLLVGDSIHWETIILKDRVDRVPTADVVPVRHGKNVGTDYDETDQFVCSECGIEIQGWYRVEHYEDDDVETIHEYRFRYCPHCGARISE